MEITETHKNGAKITVKGWNAAWVVKRWRAAQEKAEEEEPVIKGTGTLFLDSGQQRRYDTDAHFTYAPVPLAQSFGFVRNELNWRLQKSPIGG